MVAVIDRSVLLRCLLALTLAALTAMPSFSSSLHQVKKSLKAAKGLKYRNFKARGYMCLMLLGASDDIGEDLGLRAPNKCFISEGSRSGLRGLRGFRAEEISRFQCCLVTGCFGPHEP